MHSTLRWTALAAFAALAAGCASSIEVRTMAAPNAELSALRAFRILPGPARRDGRPVTGEDDPMIGNSIANNAIRDQITKSFQGRGYTLDERNADFGVAFYATAREKLDVSVWDYGYPQNPGWPVIPRQTQVVTPYTEGSVVIDVVNSRTHELLWRGEGKAELVNNPAENVMRLAKAADLIVAKFPAAVARVVAVRP